MRLGALIAPPLLALALAAPAAGAAADARIAALQVALRANGVYDGTVDGLSGPRTANAVRAIQVRAKITVDGVVGPETRKALGKLGRPGLGTRTLETGMQGWDVASLQFRLAVRGFPSGTFDGDFGEHTDAAVRRFQEWAGLEPDGVAGPATTRALARPPATSPVALSPPLYVPYTDVFGPRGSRMHTGIDFPAPSRDAGPRRASGHRHRHPLVGRLREHGRAQAQARREHRVRAPVGHPRQARRARRCRATDRARRSDRLRDGTAPALRASRARRGDRPGSRVQVVRSSRSSARCSATDRSPDRCGTHVRRPTSARARSTCSPCPSSEAVPVHTCAGS